MLVKNKSENERRNMENRETKSSAVEKTSMNSNGETVKKKVSLILLVFRGLGNICSLNSSKSRLKVK